MKSTIIGLMSAVFMIMIFMTTSSFFGREVKQKELDDTLYYAIECSLNTLDNDLKNRPATNGELETIFKEIFAREVHGYLATDSEGNKYIATNSNDTNIAGGVTNIPIETYRIHVDEIDVGKGILAATAYRSFQNLNGNTTILESKKIGIFDRQIADYKSMTKETNNIAIEFVYPNDMASIQIEDLKAYNQIVYNENTGNADANTQTKEEVYLDYAANPDDSEQFTSLTFNITSGALPYSVTDSFIDYMPDEINPEKPEYFPPDEGYAYTWEIKSIVFDEEALAKATNNNPAGINNCITYKRDGSKAWLKMYNSSLEKNADITDENSEKHALSPETLSKYYIMYAECIKEIHLELHRTKI